MPSIARAVAGAFGVVNAVSLYVERGTETFDAMHVTAAERLANEARKAPPSLPPVVLVSAVGVTAICDVS